MEISISCIVEGHGEVETVPILIRRIAVEVMPTISVQTPRPIRIPKNKLIKDGELERAVALASKKNQPNGGVVVLIDSDDNCPAELGKVLLNRATKVNRNQKNFVVLAKREFESWFIAAASSLQGCCGLSSAITSPADPESIRGAKEWLSTHMEDNRVYSETVDQPSLAASMDLSMARKAGSFDKFYRDITVLLKSSHTS